jgi:hypothetical protein
MFKQLMLILKNNQTPFTNEKAICYWLCSFNNWL